ncbi:MAG: aminotransferase class III-fold pyridoxal phosphate-dependent enzyme, partial [Nocardioidaceae bacterium]|nr:aminotransferase class III-fold pyridoxal phosphate-dependent enzyme [Nocardioidaceae bacterium]
MTDAPIGGPSLPQERRLVTEIPGPESLARLAAKQQYVADGVATGLPAFIVAGGGGVLVDADGNSFIDMGSGIAVTNVGNSAPLVAENVTDQVHKLTHTCFMVAGYEPYIEV